MSNEAKFKLGQIVKHRLFDFRGIIFDVDPEFNNTDEWYERIPEDRRPRKDQPFIIYWLRMRTKQLILHMSLNKILKKMSQNYLSNILRLSCFLTVMIVKVII
ncbi:hypothetical protein CM15mP43_04970 [bacterium]|nr:MAG: hypothetical protein CM15mP43_04970 [bacterium]